MHATVEALADKTVLKDEMAIEAAICALERHLVDPATRLNETVTQLAELEKSPHALEFVLSGEERCVVAFSSYTDLRISGEQ